MFSRVWVNYEDSQKPQVGWILGMKPSNVRIPNFDVDPRGEEMWKRLTSLINCIYIYIYQETNTDWWGTSNSYTAVFYTGDWKHWRRSFQCLNDSVFYSTHMISKGFLATMQISGLQICHINEKMGPRTTGMILYHGSMCVYYIYIHIFMDTIESPLQIRHWLGHKRPFPIVCL